MTYSLLVDFNRDGTFSEADADITRFIDEIDTQLGIDFVSSVIPKAIAARATFSGTDSENRFNPFMGQTPELRPGMGMRFNVEIGGDDYSLWEGYIQFIHYDDLVESKIKPFTIEAYGILGMLSELNFELAAQENPDAGELFEAVLDSINLPSHTRRIAGNFTELGLWFPTSTKALEQLRRVELAEGGFIHEDQRGLSANSAPELVFESAAFRREKDVSTPDLILSDNGSEIDPDRLQWISELASQCNTVALVLQQYEEITDNIISSTRPGDLAFGGSGSGNGRIYLDSPDGTAANSVRFTVETDRIVKSWDDVNATLIQVRDFGDPRGTWSLHGDGYVLSDSSWEIIESDAHSATIEITNSNSGAYTYQGTNYNYWFAILTMSIQATYFNPIKPVSVIRTYQSNTAAWFDHRRFEETVPYVKDLVSAEKYIGRVLERFVDTTPRVEVEIDASEYLLEAATVDISDSVRLDSKGEQGATYFIDEIRHKLRPGRHTFHLTLSPNPAALPTPLITNFDSSVVFPTYIDLKWSYSGVEPAEFDIEVIDNIDPDTVVETVSTSSGATRSITLDDLTPGTTYLLQVKCTVAGVDYQSIQIQRTAPIRENTQPVEITYHNGYVWVSDEDADRLPKFFAYEISNSFIPDATKEITLSGDDVRLFYSRGGITTDGTVLWASSHQYLDNIFAYALNTGIRDVSEELYVNEVLFRFDRAGIQIDNDDMWELHLSTNTSRPSDLLYRLDNDNSTATLILTLFPTIPRTRARSFCLTSDTIYVYDAFNDRIRAWNRSDNSRNTGKDITLPSTEGIENKITTDGTTLWFLDTTIDFVYAFDLSTKAQDTSNEFQLW